VIRSTLATVSPSCASSAPSRSTWACPPERSDEQRRGGRHHPGEAGGKLVNGASPGGERRHPTRLARIVAQPSPPARRLNRGSRARSLE
jgi:hypothetical protein